MRKKCQWVQGWMQCKVSSGLTRWAELKLAAGEEFGRWKYETRGMPVLLLVGFPIKHDVLVQN